MVKDTVCALHKYRWTFQDKEDTFTEVVSGKCMRDRDYIAALQRTRGDCLMLLGGGTFRLVAMHEYARYCFWYWHLQLSVGSPLSTNC